MTPYGHPIVPLLLDFQAARDAVPNMPLPQHASYPGGAERAQWHVRESLRVFRQAFGTDPSGCWPSEGAISRGTLELLDRAGFKWAATSANVLQGALTRSDPSPRATPAPTTGPTACLAATWSSSSATIPSPISSASLMRHGTAMMPLIISSTS